MDGVVYNIPNDSRLEYMVKNQTIVSAGGLDIKVVGNTITFIIGQTNWEMSVAELESMLESHQMLKDACNQMLSSVDVPLTKDPIVIKDQDEFLNGLSNSIEALRRAD